MRSGGVDIIVVDSVAALVPKSEIEGDMGEHQMGTQARLMSQAMRKLTAAVSKTKTLLIFTNQIRMKIGVMFGSPETTTGGNALKFYATQRLDIRKVGNIQEGEAVVGSRHRVKVKKNKVAPPFRVLQNFTWMTMAFPEKVMLLTSALSAMLSPRVAASSNIREKFSRRAVKQQKSNSKKNLQS